MTITREQIIAWAREAGGSSYRNRDYEGTAIGFGPNGLERFASLIEQAVRQDAFIEGYEKAMKAHQEGVAHEREQCAKVIDNWQAYAVQEYKPATALLLKEVSEAVRARGEMQ